MKIKYYQLKSIKDIMNNFKKSNTWEIILAIANNFICFIDNDKELVMQSKSDNIKIMIIDEADEVIEELFYSLKKIYQNYLEHMKGSEFVFDYVCLMYYKSHKKIQIVVDHM